MVPRRCRAPTRANDGLRGGRAFSERPASRLSEQGPTELAELARHLNEMLARIGAALDHERAFLDDASHELRTPIAIVRGELELARPLASGEPALRDALDSALEEVDRLQGLALNLLVLGRIRAAGPPPENASICVPCPNGRSLRPDRAGATSPADVTVQGAAATVGDAASLERAVTNLIDNAMRHASHRVAVEMSEEGEEAIVEIRDDGPGFADAVVDHAGQRFVPGSVDGAGLGLAIVDAIAARHGGHLELGRRADGEGAVATLHLPRADAT